MPGMPGMPTIAQIHVTMDESRKVLGADGKSTTSRTGGKNTDPTDTGSPQNSRVNKNNKSLLRNTLGINVGMAAMLKQSQIFTGVVGTIFQLIGALVDVVLAPFLPIVVPAIKLMARAIPIAATFMRKLFEKLAPIWEFFTEKFDVLPDSISSKLASLLSTILLVSFFAKLLGLWGPWMSVMKLTAQGIWFTLKVMRSIINRIFGLTGRLIGGIVEGIGKLLWDHVGTRLVSLASDIFTPITGRLNTILTKMGTLARDTFTPIIDKIVKLADDIARPIVTKLGFVIDALKGFFDEIVRVVSDALGGSWADDAAKWTLRMAKGGWDATTKAIGSGFKSYLGDDLKSIKGILSSSGTVMDAAPTSPVARELPSGYHLMTESQKFAAMFGDWNDPRNAEFLKKGGYQATGEAGEAGIEKIIQMSLAKQLLRFGRGAGAAVPFLGTVVELAFAAWTTNRQFQRYQAGEADWESVMNVAGIGATATGASAVADWIPNPWISIPTQVAISLGADYSRGQAYKGSDDRMWAEDARYRYNPQNFEIIIKNESDQKVTTDFNGTPVDSWFQGAVSP